ncbi:hypothetical protein EVAR_37082_1 [Eumeta japonica]|uniref:Uncharacterized protein n=1 Tax=Eumeta variegata TaxID=151549 RepID=A0A4C1WEZ5_EUMVA|nr:hypothetical protein EVAR_37082_1 [Eumeta japonica]
MQRSGGTIVAKPAGPAQVGLPVQVGFRKRMGCTNQAFSLQNITEKILASGQKGCEASPWLFNLFIDSCLYDLKDYEYELRMNELTVKCLLYPYDQVILTPSMCGCRTGRASQCDGWLATVSDAPLPLHFIGGASVAHGTRPRRLKWHWSISDGSIGWHRAGAQSPTHSRARAVIAHAQPAGGGASGLNCWCSTRGGREAQLKPHTQPTAGGRTLVDADRIKAARIGDPRRRRSNRARPPTADQAIHVSDGSSHGSTCQRAMSFNLLVLSHPGSRCQSGAYAGPPASARHRACAQRRVGGAPGCEAGLTRAGGTTRSTDADDRRPPEADKRRSRRGSTHRDSAAPEAARVSEQLSSSSSRQGGLSDRREAPRSIGSQL